MIVGRCLAKVIALLEKNRTFTIIPERKNHPPPPLSSRILTIQRIRTPGVTGGLSGLQIPITGYGLDVSLEDPGSGL
ncbi:protein of unknown function [Candidatus Nitrospira inopinata]|uniref:Uncharacterized protein n=1 Tax=Candidatus Nitrospira inopinata TaxID=1715989 RepID=A0A0S4KXM4_9BACT|nr:protein of unknown function [Candidatus Nitrospira inopinata]